MRSYVAFLKKEWLEWIRNFRLPVMGLVFLLLAVMSPLAARYLPEIVAEFLPAGMLVELPEPQAVDAWLQFFKNFSQIGLLVLVVMHSGILSGEYAKGTLVCILTKGMPRKNVILAKFSAAAASWSVLYIPAVALCVGYTWYFWGKDAVSGEIDPFGLLFSLSGLWLLGVMFLSILILGATLFSSAYASLLFAGGAALIQIIAGMFPEAISYIPLSMAAGSTEILQKAKEGGIPVEAALSAVAVTVFCQFLSILIFQKRKI
mgnify:FL=1